MIQIYQKIDGTVVIERLGKTLELRIHDICAVLEGIQRWNNGLYIQEALGFLSPGEREFIKTGITPDEWDEMFACHDKEYEEYENETEEVTV